MNVPYNTYGIKSKDVVIVAAGYGDNKDTYSNWCNKIAENGKYVITFDDQDTENILEAAIEAKERIDAVVAAEGLQDANFSLLGCSLGGMELGYWAAETECKVDKIAVLSSTLNWYHVKDELVGDRTGLRRTNPYMKLDAKELESLVMINVDDPYFEVGGLGDSFVISGSGGHVTRPEWFELAIDWIEGISREREV